MRVAFDFAANLLSYALSLDQECLRFLLKATLYKKSVTVHLYIRFLLYMVYALPGLPLLEWLANATQHQASFRVL